MDTGKPALYAVAIVGMFAIAGIGSGPTGAFIPELFATRYRYSGSALAVNLAGVVGGALPPLVAGTLQATYGSWAVGPMLAVLASASFVCTYLLPETKGHRAGIHASSARLAAGAVSRRRLIGTAFRSPFHPGVTVRARKIDARITCAFPEYFRRILGKSAFAGPCLGLATETHHRRRTLSGRLCFREEKFMSFVTTQPEALTAAASALQTLGTSMAAQNAAAAAPTTGVAPAAADPVSALQAAQFSAYGTWYQQVSAQATAIHQMLVNTLGTSAGSYGDTEAANKTATGSTSLSSLLGGLTGSGTSRRHVGSAAQVPCPRRAPRSPPRSTGSRMSARPRPTSSRWARANSFPER